MVRSTILWRAVSSARSEIRITTPYCSAVASGWLSVMPTASGGNTFSKLRRASTDSELFLADKANRLRRIAGQWDLLAELVKDHIQLCHFQQSSTHVKRV